MMLLLVGGVGRGREDEGEAVWTSVGFYLLSRLQWNE